MLASHFRPTDHVTMKPLQGITVLDLTRLIPGPFCSLILSNFGAKVTKVEGPLQGDYLRDLGVPLFEALNHGKKIIRLDLKSPAGKKALMRLVKKSDVLLESFRPGVMDRLGFSFATLKKNNPKLILASITGFGQQGAMKDKAGHDLNYMSLAGLISSKEIPKIQWADFIGGGLMGALKVVAALANKKRKAIHLDISMTDSMIFCGVGNILNRDGPGILTGLLGRYQIYETSDGRLVSLAALEEKFWRRFCDLIGRADLKEGKFPDARPEVKKELVQLFKTKTRDDWEKLGRENDICLTPVLTPKEVVKR